MSQAKTTPPLVTHPFQSFWGWLQLHMNCILRAGTPTAVVFDDDDLHWHFGVEDEETYLVQVIRGKRILAEMILNPSEIAYVQGRPESEEEYLFELIPPTPEAEPVFYFLMTHPFEVEETQSAPSRWTH
jgi:hypothetical protein